MSILHIKQIRAFLEEKFRLYIDLSDYNDKSKNEIDSAFLTRALAAYSIVSISNISEKNITPYITDGFKDNGIDAIYFDEAMQTLYLIQSKWHHEGSGVIDKGDALKYIRGVKDIFEENYEKFNEKLNKLSVYISRAIRSPQTKVVLIICHTGTQKISDEIMEDIDDFLKEVNDTTEILKLLVFDQEKIHKSIASNTSAIEINENIGLSNWGLISEPYKSVYGIISAEEVVNWYRSYSPFLFAPNIRLFLGQTDVNGSLENTISTNPEYFVYFNNGITLLCDKFEKLAVGGSKRDNGIFDCRNIAIINGAQTVGTIGKAYESDPESIKKVFIHIKIISLEGCPEGFGALITKATNTQNRIDSRDFVSQDEENERLKRELLIDKVNYSYKRGDTIERIENGFDFEEGIVALACSHDNINFALTAKRYVSSLWNDIKKTPYIALINKSLVGSKYWKIVQTFRIIEKVLIKKKKNTTGKKTMYLVHGNRLIEYFIFRDIFNKYSEKEFVENQLSDLEKFATESLDLILEKLFQTVESKYPDSMLAFLFKNITKCTNISKDMGY
nr:AIPR family protein [Treponema socranskii]